MFRPTTEQKAALAELGSTYKFHHRSPKFKREHGELEVTKPADVVCELRDIVTKRTWAEAVGGDKPSALSKVLAEANPEHRPKTVPQIVQENAELKAKLAELEAKDNKKPAKSGDTKPPKPDSTK